MVRKSKLNVVFMGGSITWGAASTKYENSWAFKVGEYLKQRLTGFDLNFFNAAISGTATAFGVFRLKEHVLEYKPDIIFIEYAVNDSLEAEKDKEQVKSTLGYILRRLIESNPDIKIILLYSAMKDWKACAEVHEEVALRYNVPSINIQAHVKQLIDGSNYTWEELFADAVHPSDLGHEVYFKYIVDALEKDWGNFFGSSYTLDKSLAKYKFCLPRIAGFEGVKLYGNWEIKRMEDNYKRIDAMKVGSLLFSEAPGSTLEFGFYGTHIGLYHYLDRHCGICSIKIDDEPEIKQDFFYETDREFLSFFTRFGLKTGEHTLRIELLEEKNEKSKGNIVAIAGFLID